MRLAFSFSAVSLVVALGGGGDYLYRSEDVAPVIEYIASEVPSDTIGTHPGEQRWYPYFLNSTDNGPKIVEFYAPWCSHCRHYKPHYIALARKAVELAALENVDVKFYAVSCTANKEICQRQGIKSYPSVKAFQAGSTDGTIVKRSQLHPFTVLQLFNIGVSNLDAFEESASAKKMRKKEKESPSANKRTKNQLHDDASLSFHFSMRNGIFLEDEPLSDMKRNAFSSWIDLLHRTLPPTWNVHEGINAIRENIESAAENESAFIEILDEHKPGKSTWSMACTHGDEYAGYTCGLWELFHIITIGLVEWNSVTPDEKDQISTLNAADTVRDFVANFFGCEVCQKNFLREYDACENNRCNRLSSEKETLDQWRELALWLWETHNDVNVRLTKEKAKRENRNATSKEEMTALWPSKRECSMCWFEDGSWDEDVIYTYLRLEYWPDDEKSVEQRRNVHRKEARRQDYTPSVFLLPFFSAAAMCYMMNIWWLMKRRHGTRTGDKRDRI